jgi:hypothetical protein
MATTKRTPQVSPGNYTGELAEPIYEPSRELLAERVLEKWSSKIGFLFDWYEIDSDASDAWRLLALNLAVAHVPGMRFINEAKRKRGRKKSWKAGLGAQLVREVEALKTQQFGTYLEAIEALRRDKAKHWHSFTKENLITRHREARKAERARKNLIKLLMGSD